jgi:hypothetical protein
MSAPILLLRSLIDVGATIRRYFTLDFKRGRDKAFALRDAAAEYVFLKEFPVAAAAAEASA